MVDLVQSAQWIISRFDLRSLLDILIVAGIFYWLLLLLQGTTAMSLLRGILILIMFTVITVNLLQLTVLNWILRTSLTAMLVAIPILFQPELRRALERIGRTGFRDMMVTEQFIDTVCKACRNLSDHRYGALIVLERETGLQEYVEKGIRVDGAASIELLVSIFFPNSPLHDGAVILRNDRVLAASCVLPLSDHNPKYPTLRTRHLAAIGISEQTDAISIVISEETGDISIANNGRMIRGLDENKLRRLLVRLYGPVPKQPFRWWHTPAKDLS